MPSPDLGPPGHPLVRITVKSGSITVVGEPRTDIVADGAAVLDADQDGSVEVVPRNRSTSVTVRCPERTSVVAGTQSGSLLLQGSIGAARASTISGRIHVEDALSADLRAVSGSIIVDDCVGTCRAKTKSGSVHIGSAGAAEVTIGSGSVRVDHVEGGVRVRAVSGSVGVAAAGHGQIEVETISGSITITLPPDCHPDVRARSLSSRPRIEVAPGGDCVVVAKTLSGGVVVRSA